MHVLAVFMTSLAQSAVHNMAALTVESLRLLNVSFLFVCLFLNT